MMTKRHLLCAVFLRKGNDELWLIGNGIATIAALFFMNGAAGWVTVLHGRV
ncbi:hypothetical protein NX722_00825 [Endozoicomonas gorgoniicola]|uniref:Uncharacterized protein n=1 Tax=Endozoicomonas gorgoniicola TaxID=1234144 RepID=A0ABT3MPD1_9GAMM|nr:hypothetical protein [Endozoicomonas gorgoniicola]MCW7551222.1 hypothetical protein [Endozoicomonas gorgoniicola]